MSRLNKTKSAFFTSLMCSLLPEDRHSELILASLTLLHPERPKLYAILVFLSAIGLSNHGINPCYIYISENNVILIALISACLSG